MATKLSQLDNALGKLANKFEKKSKDWTLLAIKQAEAIFMNRVFNENKTKSGQTFGRYKTKAWKKKRSDAGRQVSRKDLQMTNQLRNSIKPVRKTKSRMTLEFVGQGTYTSGKKTRTVEFIDIADGQENQIGKGDIFEFSEKEKKEIFTRVEKEVSKDIRKIVKESFR